MSINQITTANTFGQLVTAVAAMIAVANNLTDGPQVTSNSSWTYTNPSVGINVSNTALIKTANVQVLNAGFANIVSGNIASINTSTANATTINVINEFVTTLWGTEHHTANANVSGLLQVSDRMNVYSANIQSANIGTVSITTLNVTQLTVPVLNTSFANVTTLSVTGTSQHVAIIATLVTTTNANVSILNASAANITGLTAVTANATTGNITTLTVGTFNTSSANLTQITTPVLNASFANITSANIVSQNTSSLNVSNSFFATLNASTANLTTGTMAVNPTVNLGIATKNYADTGAGGNLVNKITFNAKGDLITGTGANTFAALAAGANGQSLVVDTQTATGLRWATRGLSQTFRGLSLGTSQADKVANGNQIIVYKLDEAVMDDGEVVTGWATPGVIDITASGIGGLDGGTANANTWYEVYAVRKRVDGTKNFIIHRAIDRKPDQNTMNGVTWPIASYASVGANSTVALANLKLAMGFTPNVSGPLTSIEIRGFKTSTPTGNVWLTLEANTAGFPSGTALATTRKYDVARMQITTQYPMRFVFDTTANVTAATAYYWVLNNDYPASATAFMNLTYHTSPVNTAVGVNPGIAAGNSGTSWARLDPGIGTFIYKTYIESNSTSITMPAGYDQKCLISYTATDLNNKLREYRQRDRTISTFFTPQWNSFQSDATGVEQVADMSGVIPPITCDVSLFAYNPSGGISFITYGSMDALDLPGTAVAELTRGMYFGQSASSGNLAAPATVAFWVEQQAFTMRTAANVTKLYPFTITF